MLIPSPLCRCKIELRPSRVEHLLGAKIDKSKICQILGDLEIWHTADGNIIADQPSFRPDLVREVDLIEEIARVYGFDNIPPIFQPGGTLATPMTRQERLTRQNPLIFGRCGRQRDIPLNSGRLKVGRKAGYPWMNPSNSLTPFQRRWGWPVPI